MCVRYTFHEPDRAIAAVAAALAMKLAPLPESARPRFNVTLTHVVPTVATGADGPELRGMMWGLVPFYERSKPQARMLPNAKAETAATLSAFKQSVAQRRCLIPANGFYEWQTCGKLKLPHLFTLRDEEPFAFAGIWEPGAPATSSASTRPSDLSILTPDSFSTFAILTTAPNELVAPVHNRMPVILTAETIPRWLGRAPLAEAEYHTLTQPLPAERMQMRPVSRYVSNSRHDGPQCHASPEEPPSELALG